MIGAATQKKKTLFSFLFFRGSPLVVAFSAGRITGATSNGNFLWGGEEEEKRLMLRDGNQ
jgi:hypothetical protein